MADGDKRGRRCRRPDCPPRKHCRPRQPRHRIQENNDGPRSQDVLHERERRSPVHDWLKIMEEEDGEIRAIVRSLSRDKEEGSTERSKSVVDIAISALSTLGLSSPGVIQVEGQMAAISLAGEDELPVSSREAEKDDVGLRTGARPKVRPSPSGVARTMSTSGALASRRTG